MLEDGQGVGQLYRTLNQARVLEQMFLAPPLRCKKKIIIFYGDSETGKSTKAYETWPNHYRIPLTGKTENMFFQNYQGQSVCVIDEFARLDRNGMTVTTKWNKEVLNELTEESPTIINVKGGSAYSQLDTFVLTSQVSPNVWYPETVINMDQMHAWARRITAAYHFKAIAKPLRPEDVPRCRTITLTHGIDVLGLDLRSNNTLFPEFYEGFYRHSDPPLAAPPPAAPKVLLRSKPSARPIVYFPPVAVTNPLPTTL